MYNKGRVCVPRFYIRIDRKCAKRKMDTYVAAKWANDLPSESPSASARSSQSNETPINGKKMFFAGKELKMTRKRAAVADGFAVRGGGGYGGDDNTFYFREWESACDMMAMRCRSSATVRRASL